MDEFRTPDADAKSENELAAAGTATMTKDFSEAGHAMMSDTNVQELMSGLVCLLSLSSATLKASLDSVAAARATNAAVLDNMVQFNAAHLSNLVNSASHRHSEIAADRQWNVNETDLYATIAGAVTAAVLASVAKDADED